MSEDVAWTVVSSVTPISYVHVSSSTLPNRGANQFRGVTTRPHSGPLGTILWFIDSVPGLCTLGLPLSNPIPTPFRVRFESVRRRR